MRFDLSRLPPAVVGVRVRHAGASTDSRLADDADQWGHNEQIDVNLTIANIARVVIVTFGVTAAFGALTTERGTRYQLQCALAAAACLVTTAFYVKLHSVRRAKAVAYTRAGSAAVDSYRHSCWVVTNGTLAWLGMLLHGPFGHDGNGTFYDVGYGGWVRMGPALSSGSVVCSGAAQFCAEAARYSSSRGAFVAWGLLGLVFLLLAMGASLSVSLALQLEGDRSARSHTEIRMGQILGGLWFAYPATNVLKIVVTFFSTHNSAELLGERAARVVKPVAAMGDGLRQALVWSLRIVSSSHAYSPLPPGLIEESESTMGYALVAPVYTQIFDALLAMCDLVSIGMPALGCTALALPVAE